MLYCLRERMFHPALFSPELLMSLGISRGPEMAAAAQVGLGFCLLLTQGQNFF
jgi:hypothetical protein